MGNRDINDADPRLQRVHAHVLAHFAALHPDFPKLILSEVYRSQDLQRAYYAQGREPVARVNSQRRLVGLAPITEDENRKKVTNSKPGQSKHQHKPSKAVDYLFVEGKAIVQDEKYYKALADFILTFDPTVTWGADWNHNGKSSDEKFVDRPHFEV
jgi:hypothetical protein